MNSWTTTVNAFLKQFGTKYLRGDNEENILKNDSWKIFLKIPEDHLKDMPSYINKFLEVVYTIGNFALVPGPGGSVDFNRRRNSKFKDYWDLALLEIYRYYMNGNESKCLRSFENKTEAEKKAKAKEALESWLNSSGESEGQEGWNNFVENNFMQPFVEKAEGKNYGRPYELWDGHFTGKQTPEEERQFEQFFVNARIRILQRGELIAKKLVNPE